MNDSNLIEYVVDTNVFIDLDLWYPFECSSGFWSQLKKALEQKKFILLDVVVDEIKYSRANFKKWLEEQKKNGFVTKISDEAREKAVEINNKYKMIDENSGNSQIDTYLIAYALLNNLKIFTREGPRKKLDELYKIPDTCKELGIECIRSPKLFFSHIGYKGC
jgi:hypothetical protein